MASESGSTGDSNLGHHSSNEDSTHSDRTRKSEPSHNKLKKKIENHDEEPVEGESDPQEEGHSQKRKTMEVIKCPHKNSKHYAKVSF